MMPYNINDYQPFREGRIQYLHLLKTVASISGKMSISSIFGTLR